MGASFDEEQVNVSIITAVYNAATTLDRFFNSIIAQTFDDFELIIIDGGSTDNSVDLIRKYHSCISYWISEADGGIYDAWNKGIKKAKGKWIMFLGADDILLPNALFKYNNYINSHDRNHFDYISSRVQMIDTAGKPIWINGWSWEWPKFLRKMTVAHPGSLHSLKLFEKYGVYDTQYRVTADYELLLRPREKLNAGFMNEITVWMAEGGASDSFAAIKEHYKAATTTGGASKFMALLAGTYTWIKTNINRKSRKFGINLNIKRK